MHAWHRRGVGDVDAHVLVHHGRARKDWLDRCVASLEQEPVNILLVYDDRDHLGQLHAEAYAACSAPYVSAVDDDDWVEAGAHAACLLAMGNAVGAYTDMACHDAAGSEIARTQRPPWAPELHRFRPTEILHLRVMRRAAVVQCAAALNQFAVLDCIALNTALARVGRWVKVDVLGYRKTLHPTGAHQRHTLLDWHRHDLLARGLL